MRDPGDFSLSARRCTMQDSGDFSRSPPLMHHAKPGEIPSAALCPSAPSNICYDIPFGIPAAGWHAPTHWIGGSSGIVIPVGAPTPCALTAKPVGLACDAGAAT